jgi:DNA-binding IclR family transcriptional regulator
MVLTVEKVSQILNLFSAENPEWGVSEVSRALGISKSAASELMSTMEAGKLLRRTSRRRYRLGWRLLGLSQTLLETTEFRTEAREVLRDLMETWKETVHLAVLDGAQAVWVEKLQPTPTVKIPASGVGARLPAHSTAGGRMLLAGCEWENVAEAFAHQGMPPLTQNTITAPDELKTELERVRHRGYAVDDEAACVGLCCVAAPVRDENGEVIAAVSLSVPAFRFQEGSDEYTAAVLEAAVRMSQHSERPNILGEFDKFAVNTRGQVYP